MPIRSAAVSAPNPALMALLAQLTGTQSASGDTSAFTQSASSTSTSQESSANNALTGSSSASLSSEILNLLIQMRQHVSAGGGTTASATTSFTSASTPTDPLDQLLSTLDASLTASASTSTMANPLQQLFSSIDATDHGGQSEFLSVATTNGGTSESSDFAGLHPGESGRLTTANLTQARENLQNNQSSGSAAVSLLDAFAKTNIATSTASTMA